MWNADDDGAEDDDDDDEDDAAAVGADNDVDDVDLLLPPLSKANYCDVTAGCCRLRG